MYLCFTPKDVRFMLLAVYLFRFVRSQHAVCVSVLILMLFGCLVPQRLSVFCDFRKTRKLLV